MGKEYVIDPNNIDYSALYERLEDLLDAETELSILQKQINVVKKFFRK